MNATVNPNTIHNPYIYLDWNIFKYMKENRTQYAELDRDCFQMIKKLKRKYRFPISQAHIRDRMSRYSEFYIDKVKEDFDFVNSVSEGFFVTNIPDMNNELGLVSIDIRNCYRDYLEETDITQDESVFDSFISNRMINIDDMDTSHPMYDYIKENNGELRNMNAFLEKMYNDVFDETSVYSSLREYIRKFDVKGTKYHVSSLREMCELDKLMYHMAPFLLSYGFDSLEKLKENWREIAKRFFSYNELTAPSELLLMQGYVLLDMHPLFKKEKLKKKKNTLDNIIRDGNHCYYASKAKYFVSEDEGVRKKVSFLYEVYGIKTNVKSEQEFMNTVTII